MPRRYAKKTDSNEREIVECLQKHGYQVIRIGEPLDLLVGKGAWVLMEVKASLTHSLQRSQIEFLSTVRGHAGVVTNAEEALALANLRQHVLTVHDQTDIIGWLLKNPDQGKLSVNQFRKLIA